MRQIDSSLMGTVEGANMLIEDLFLSLRDSVNAWSMVTNQTPQARMGYVGQHLASIVTGFPGGKSGARGYDIVFPDGGYGEIKTCYRVDQLGSCNNCGSVVSAMEKECAACGSKDIQRKDDSKWLITIQNEKELNESIDPNLYYFVLFEFEDINNPDSIIASIWEVDPLRPGFALCMSDYYLNIRANSSSKAPFNMWPYKPKFYLTCPKLIYRSVIKSDNTIETQVFPNTGTERYTEFDFSQITRATTFTIDNLKTCIKLLTGQAPSELGLPNTKRALADYLKEYCENHAVDNATFCDCLARSVYSPLLISKRAEVPSRVQYYILDISDL